MAIIFDNIEEPSVLDDYWPTSSRGSVLITSRHENVAYGVNVNTLMISPFSTEQSSALLLKMLHRTSYSEEEKQGAEALSSVLGGLALATRVAAMQIRFKKMPIQKFVRAYTEKGPSALSSTKIKNVFYKHSLETLWKAAFSSLNSNAASILDAACFCAPDNLPISLFNHHVSELHYEDHSGNNYE
jgi:hypothetical protein